MWKLRENHDLINSEIRKMKKVKYTLEECATIKHRADDYRKEDKQDESLLTYCECLIGYSYAVFSRQISLNGVFQLFFFLIQE